jgi:D-alanyl-D-alanine carboxypeptidase
MLSRSSGTNSSDPGAPLRAALAARQTPAVQYVAVNARSTLFEFCGGDADLEHDKRIDARTTMMAYSMSKTITAVSVLQLIDRKRLGLDEPLTRYVSWQPYDPSPTIRQLLSHTGGIPNPIPLKWVHSAEAHASFDERSALVAAMQRSPRLSSIPGSKYAYSNLGYWLLGAVVSISAEI